MWSKTSHSISSSDQKTEDRYKGNMMISSISASMCLMCFYAHIKIVVSLIIVFSIADLNSKCNDPFCMIFGHMDALGSLYLQTGFLILSPSGKREWGRKASQINEIKFTTTYNWSIHTHVYNLFLALSKQFDCLINFKSILRDQGLYFFEGFQEA